MADPYSWFKFDAEAYLSGKIMHQTLEAQGVFNQISALCWKLKGPVDKSELYYRNPRDIAIIDSSIASLEAVKLIVVNGDMISIKYMDELLEDVEETRVKKSRAGKASAESRKKKSNNSSTGVQQVLEKVQQNPTDKIREEKIRKEQEQEDLMSVVTQPPTAPIEIPAFDVAQWATDKPLIKLGRYDDPTRSQFQALGETHTLDQMTTAYESVKESYRQRKQDGDQYVPKHILVVDLAEELEQAQKKLARSKIPEPKPQPLGDMAQFNRNRK